jgi:phosphoserine phosphatase
LYYSLDRVKVLASENPSLKDTQPFKAILERDMKTISNFTKADIVKFVMTTHDGKSPSDFQKLVKNWFDTAVHPHFKFSFYDCAFKPQIQLLEYLKVNGFKVFICSAGGTDFMRTVTKKMYDLEHDRVIGSTGLTNLEMIGNKPEIVRTQQLVNFNDRDQKPLNIHRHTGKRPILAFGNSDGDLRMLQYALGNTYPSMGLILHHDDNVREIAYDRDFKISARPWRARHQRWRGGRSLPSRAPRRASRLHHA